MSYLIHIQFPTELIMFTEHMSDSLINIDRSIKEGYVCKWRIVL